MPQQPPRRPGESDPRLDADAAMRPVRDSELSGGKGGYGIGGTTITRGVVALLAWRKRRKSMKRR